MFFKAGQISIVQKILNETGPDKAPWIFQRLQEALANRQKAKAAAEESQVRVPRPPARMFCVKFILLFCSVNLGV